MGHGRKGEKRREGGRFVAAENRGVGRKGGRKFTAAIFQRKLTLRMTSHDGGRSDEEMPPLVRRPACVVSL